MSVEQFLVRLGRAQVHPNDLKWMPSWIKEYAGMQEVGPDARLDVNQERVLQFLRSLRDGGVSAWQRLQAARAVEWYQALVLDRADVDFGPFKK